MKKYFFALVLMTLFFVLFHNHFAVAKFVFYLRLGNSHKLCNK